MNNFIKNIIAAIIIVSFMGYGWFFPKPAKAVIPVNIDASGSIWTTVANTLGGWGATIAGWAKDAAWRAWDYAQNNWQKWMRDIIAKLLIDRIVDQTVQWIQGGGEPQFVADWQGFLSDSFDQASGAVIERLGLDELCSPFGLQLQISLYPVKTFSQQYKCTIEDVGFNLKNFYGNFISGGWNKYIQLWQPQNNFYGATLIAENEMLREGLIARQAALNEVQAGQGFLSIKRCKAGSGLIAEDIAFFNNDPTKFGYHKDLSGQYCDPTDLEITTPGNIVGQAAASAITSDMGWAQNIESWMSALINAVINRLITEGMSSLGSSEDYEGGSYYPAKYRKLAEENIISQTQGLSTNYEELSSILEEVIDVKQTSLAKIERLRNTLSQLQAGNCEGVDNQKITWTENKEIQLKSEIGEDDLSTPTVDETGKLILLQRRLKQSIEGVKSNAFADANKALKQSIKNIDKIIEDIAINISSINDGLYSINERIKSMEPVAQATSTVETTVAEESGVDEVIKTIQTTAASIIQSASKIIVLVQAAADSTKKIYTDDKTTSDNARVKAGAVADAVSSSMSAIQDANNIVLGQFEVVKTDGSAPVVYNNNSVASALINTSSIIDEYGINTVINQQNGNTLFNWLQTILNAADKMSLSTKSLGLALSGLQDLSGGELKQIMHISSSEGLEFLMAGQGDLLSFDESFRNEENSLFTKLLNGSKKQAADEESENITERLTKAKESLKYCPK